MASAPGPSARLRRTFQYPNDSDSDSQPEAMDEQEQDNLIALLASENTIRNTQFTRFLLALPLFTTIVYLQPLFRPATAMFSLLSITSLLASAFLLHRLPPTETGIDVIDNWARSGSETRRRNEQAAAAARAGGMGRLGRHLGGEGDKSPLEKYLPYLNLGLVVLLIVMGLVRGDDRGGGFGWISMGNLPGLVYSVCVTAKIVMAGVDPERDLSGLRYEYKGA